MTTTINKTNVFNQIRLEDLPLDLQLFAELIGLEQIKRLIKEMPSNSIYIPKISKLDKFIKRIIDENPDKSIRQIGIMMGVSESYIRQNFTDQKKRIRRRSTRKIKD